MCGLVALFSPDARPLGDLGRAMNALVRHRGPDDEGYLLLGGRDLAPQVLGGDDTPETVYRAPFGFSPRASMASVTSSSPASGDATIALAHRRLSIVDLSASGHQPMSDVSGRYWIVYNGEVYNHIELRAELESRGHDFVSHSDTEVMLHAYQEWGEACLERFNGMFAFVIVDRTVRRVLIARDRFGVKPLYWWRAPDGLLAFASEIKQFRALPGWRARINGQRAYDFLNWGLFDHEADTLFADVRQLRGGEMIACSLDELRHTLPVRRWYALQPATPPASLHDAGVRVRELLQDSVRLRLRADVPVGSCLSGGLDSSSIVCLANRELRAVDAHALQKTFSARSTDARIDEGRHMEAVVSRTGVANFQVTPRFDELFAELGRIVWHQDEPFGSTSIYAQWRVFELAARHGVRVMLDGQGADEQFAGYHPFYTARFAGLLRELRLRQLITEMREVARVHRLTGKRLLGYAVGPFLPDGVRQALRRIARKPAASDVDWLDLRALGAQAQDPYARAGSNAKTIEGLSRAQLLHTSLPMLLHWEDRDSMAHSVEARVPFLDYRLVECVLGLPDDYKLRGAVTKRVLREAMQDVLPESIRTRTDKIGFATAEEQWLRQEAPDAFRGALRRSIEMSAGIVRPAALDHLEEMIDGKRAFSFLPWRLICFGAWIERFGVAAAG